MIKDGSRDSCHERYCTGQSASHIYTTIYKQYDKNKVVSSHFIFSSKSFDFIFYFGHKWTMWGTKLNWQVWGSNISVVQLYQNKSTALPTSAQLNMTASLFAFPLCGWAEVEITISSLEVMLCVSHSDHSGVQLRFLSVSFNMLHESHPG